MTSTLYAPTAPCTEAGEARRIQPAIEWIAAVGGLPQNRYRAGGIFRIEGARFGDWDDVPGDLGLYLVPLAGGPIVRVTHYYFWRDGEIEGTWPCGLRGAQRLILETRESTEDDVRSTTYPHLLLP